MSGHELKLEPVELEDGRWFRAWCTCGGWESMGRTNAVLGNGKRHRTAAQRKEARS